MTIHYQLAVTNPVKTKKRLSDHITGSRALKHKFDEIEAGTVTFLGAANMLGCKTADVEELIARGLLAETPSFARRPKRKSGPSTWAASKISSQYPLQCDRNWPNYSVRKPQPFETYLRRSVAIVGSVRGVSMAHSCKRTPACLIRKMPVVLTILSWAGEC